MGCCCLCTNTAVKEPDPMVSRLGSWTSGCLLAKPCHPIFLSQYPKVSNICCSLRFSVLLHDTNYICAITCQSGGSWKSCSLSEASNRSVRRLLSPVWLHKLFQSYSSISLMIWWYASSFDNLQRSCKILPTGFSSGSSFEIVSLYPPNGSDDYVKSWRLCLFIITGKKDCFEILLLHAGECVPWKHNCWHSIWTTIFFSPRASYPVNFFTHDFFYIFCVPFIVSCYLIYLFKTRK